MSKKLTSKKVTRRTFVAGTVAGAAVATGSIGFPTVLRAAPKAVKVGLIHPVTGFLAFAGAQCRYGCVLAIADLNAAGGIKSMGGAKLEAILGDSQTKPQIGAAEVEKMNESGVNAFSGCYQSSVGLAATAAAAKYNIPFSIDIGVSDRLTGRGLKNVFRMADGYGRISKDAATNLGNINRAAGSPAKSVVVIHEESEYGSGTAKLMEKFLPAEGIEVLEVIKHSNPTRNFDNIALRIKAMKPDIVMPINYPGEYVLLARTLRQQKVDVTSYSVLGGGFNFKFIADLPSVAEYMIDVNHWYDPGSKFGQQLRKRVEADGKFFTFEVYLAYNSIRLLHDAWERAGTADNDAVNASLASSTLDPLMMPYEATKMVNGQNVGSRAVSIQALNGDVQIIYPTKFASAKAVFPRPKA